MMEYLMRKLTHKQKMLCHLKKKILPFCLNLCPLVYVSRKEAVFTAEYKHVNLSQFGVLSWKERC